MIGTGKRGKKLFLRAALALCLIAVSVCMSMLSPAALASGGIDTGKTCSLTLSCISGGNPLPGMTFRLYRVADVSGNAEFTLCGDFKDYPVIVNNLESSGWNTAAGTLAFYTGSDSISPQKTGNTDSTGSIRFDTLQTGLYLLVGGSLTAGNTVYSADPVLIALPGVDSGGHWNYDVTAIPKLSADEVPGGTVDITVLKAWNDSGYKQNRPASVQVALLRNNTVFDTYTLTVDNYWRHTWTGLDGSAAWTVVEKDVPDNYTVTYTAKDTVLTVTNTYKTPPEEPEEPDLPQTGILWWPVPVMAGFGVVCFGAGWLRRFGRKDNTDAK